MNEGSLLPYPRELIVAQLHYNKELTTHEDTIIPDICLEFFAKDDLLAPIYPVVCQIAFTQAFEDALSEIRVLIDTYHSICLAIIMDVREDPCYSRPDPKSETWTYPFSFETTQIRSKFNRLKKKYKAIERYNKSSGRGPWDDEFGANIDEMSEENVQSWEQYLATTPSDGVEGTWKKRKKSPEGALVSQEVNYSDLFTEEQYAKSGSKRIDAGAMSTAFDLDLNNLMGLSMDITLPDPTIQYTALHSMLLTLKQLPVIQLSPQGGIDFPPIPRPNIAIPSRSST
ncbi:hypothetical protein JVT61DRAFT_6763 [Boletus reticuloceps]|uniref:Uncharacterized protein n=1 Tax=Boletus reticuloceps TaxID=495285 RepID=A0A8I2YIU6_9AGAM|nr:hypothetical protein JVT61DRAFT_6763 [Boletus reticuloceps]